MMKNQIAQYVGIQEIKMVDCPMPTPNDDEVVIKMEYVGICGSDMHFYKDGRSGKNIKQIHCPDLVLFLEVVRN